MLIAGPCQIESRGHALEVAAALRELSDTTGVPLIYKSSFDKANRTSAAAARGVGMAQGLAILAEVRERTGLPTLTDVHAPDQCAPAAEAVDVLQIPAFLCRQTDLLLAAGATGRAINVKKGQFLAPWDMAHVAAKIAGTGNREHPAVRARRQLRLQHAGQRHARAADHGAHRLSGGVRCDALGAAAGRAGGVIRWRARIRPGAGAGGAGGGRRGGVHRDAPRSGSRAERRAEHDPVARDAGAGAAAEGVRRAGENAG